MSEKEKMPEENRPDIENIRKDEEKMTSDLKSDQHTESQATSEEKSEVAHDNILSSEEARAKETDKQPEDTAVELEAEANADSTRNDESEEASSKNAQQEVDDAVAEDSEDESSKERHGIEKKAYHSMSKQELTDELERLLKKEKVQNIKEHVDELRNEFNAKFDEELEEKKEEFLAEGGNIIDFYYSTPIKKRFNSLYFDYKEKRNRYYEQLRQDLNKNLQRRLEIIDELKGLIDVEENINTTYNNFKQLQERWRNAGPIPRDKYNTIWNTYHHHVENFYDFLHLNREFRDLDFKHNLEQKLKVINRAEELTQEPDINRAFRELQMLHKMWKEDLGPVEKEYRETIWEKFSEATRKIHDLRQAHFEQLEKEFEKNLEYKREIIAKIAEIAKQDFDNHNDWQDKIKEIEALRTAFFNAGKVPRNVNEATWSKFKHEVRTFNRKKNSFYKNQKKEQVENLEKKKDLVRIAEENKDSEDFELTTDLMKRIQSEWKQVGHVPKKESDKLWKRFKAACNHYFDRLHALRREENKEENEIFDRKKELLDSLRNMEFSGEREKDLPKIRELIEEWKKTGKVPQKRRFIEAKFNKVLDQTFAKLDMDKKQAEMLKYENKIQQLEESDDGKQLNKEHFFLTKRIEEAKAEIRQLENNLQFFSNVEQDNPLVQEVLQNIANQKEQLKIWEKKLEKVNSLYEED